MSFKSYQNFTEIFSNHPLIILKISTNRQIFSNNVNRNVPKIVPEFL